MAELCRSGIVYRRGKRRWRDFVPRQRDLVTEKEGDIPGLSTDEVPIPEKVSQMVDLEKLQAPLQAFRDAPGHVVITVVGEDGKIDMGLLEEWALSRERDECHPLTQILLDAIVGQHED